MPSWLLSNPLTPLRDDRMFNVQVIRPVLFVSTLFQGAANPDVACVSYPFAPAPLLEEIESMLLTMLESFPEPLVSAQPFPTIVLSARLKLSVKTVVADAVIGSPPDNAIDVTSPIDPRTRIRMVAM